MAKNEAIILDEDYKKWLLEVKADYSRSQIKAAVRVNEELIRFYWRLGRGITLLRSKKGWGEGFIEKLSHDLKHALPSFKGFTPQNLRYMQRFYELFPANQAIMGCDDINEPNIILPQFEEESELFNICLQPAGELMLFENDTIYKVPWYHIRIILDKCGKSQKKAIFYIEQTVKNNWSRAVLLNFLDSGLYERSGRSINNFEITLPKEDSDLARQMINDPLNLDFLSLRTQYDEKELKDALIRNIERFLMELGRGFAYMGREYRLTIGEDELFCDMLFYNAFAHAYVVVEVKTKRFEPAHLGQLDGYVAVVDQQLKRDADNPTIGLLICKSKNETLVKYCVDRYLQPIGVSSYEFTRLPEDYMRALPSVEEIERELDHTGLSINEKKYSDIIKVRREELCITQQQLADLSGLSRSAIARIETGTYPPLVSLLKVYSVLGLKMKLIHS